MFSLKASKEGSFLASPTYRQFSESLGLQQHHYDSGLYFLWLSYSYVLHISFSLYYLLDLESLYSSVTQLNLLICKDTFQKGHSHRSRRLGLQHIYLEGSNLTDNRLSKKERIQKCRQCSNMEDSYQRAFLQPLRSHLLHLKPSRTHSSQANPAMTFIPNILSLQLKGNLETMIFFFFFLLMRQARD